MIDIHCHLAFPGLDEIKDKVILESKKSMRAIITCGLSGNYKQTLELAKKYSEFIYASLGIHPEDIINMNDENVEKDLEFIRNNADDIVAVGEIGLDYSWVTDSKKNERCKEIFVKCLDIAKETNLPVILHSRKAEEDVFKIVNESGVKKAVFHHYSGNMTLANQIIENGYYISIPTIIGTSKNLKKIGKNFPLEKLMTETDSPFNSPTKEKTNYPYNVKLTLMEIAELRGIPFETVDAITTDNAIKFFNLA
ncbi:MAG: TatD family hydrolase [Candidatus Aenigmarchaeota archaeon]|nr:TatD family hydrolase [Candidatus Aenigmarchaeota archaeon]